MYCGMDDFRETVWQHYRQFAREMPWREEPTFYHVLVSEIMLQQTQVARVMVKYAEFMKRFPTIEALAASPQSEVLRAWQGLGYNRRARYLHLAAKLVSETGEPTALAGLQSLPGVGKNTAGAVMNYVYQVPTAYVETNIRTVYFHHFFDGVAEVSDREILALVERTMDREHPRQWFWALMDYGSWLKSQGLGRIATSKHYKKQSPLAGSLREMRGRIVRALTAGESTVAALEVAVDADQRFSRALESLVGDELVVVENGIARLTK